MTRTPPEIRHGTLPEPIVRVLHRLIHRVRSVILLRGIAAVIAVAVGALLVIMAIDAKFPLYAGWQRWLLSLGALGVTVAAALWLLIFPLARTITMTGIARAIEERHPELEERISSAVELLTSRDLPSLRGSEALIAALAKEASIEAVHVQPRTEVTLRVARPYLFAAGGVVVLMGAVLAIYREPAAFLLKRAIAPFLDLPTLNADALIVTPGDKLLMEGQRLQVQVGIRDDAKGVPATWAELQKILPDGSRISETMTSVPAGKDEKARFIVSCPPASESFRYRVHVGDAWTRHYSVTVVPPPSVKRLEVRYDYPAYIQRDPRTEEDSQGDIRGVIGTVVTVTAITNKPVTSAELEINGVPATDAPVQLAAASSGASACKFQIRLAPKVHGRWSLQLADQYGFTNSSGDHLIEATPDAPPVVKILAPENKKLRLKPTDRLPIAYAITDDYGLSGAEFTIETDARKRADKPLALPTAAASPVREAADTVRIDLASLPLAGTTGFIVRLRATDNLPPDSKGPQEGLSEVLTVELDVKALPVQVQFLNAEEETIHKLLERILAELKAAKEDSVPLKDALPKAATLTPDLLQRLDRMRGQLGQAKGDVADLGTKVAAGTFAHLTPKVATLADEVGAANDRAGQVKVTETAVERGSLGAETDQHVDRAIELVMELMKELTELAEVARTALTLEDLAHEQAVLAAVKAAEPTTMAAAEWAKQQAEVAHEVGELVKANPKSLEAALAQAAAKAKDLAAEAAELKAQELAAVKEAEQLKALQGINEQLKALAAEQAKLAQEAAAQPVAADQAPPMTQAAKNIEGGNLAQAVQEQKAIEAALAQKSGQPPEADQQQVASAQQPTQGEQGAHPPSQGEHAGQTPAQQGQQTAQPPTQGQQAAQTPTQGEQGAHPPTQGEHAGQTPTQGQQAAQTPTQQGQQAAQTPPQGQQAAQTPTQG